MKRNNRMVDISTLTDRITQQTEHPAFRAALVEAMPMRILGPVIASHIDRVVLEDLRLILTVKDPTWRREIGTHRQMLIIEARKLLKDIVVVQIVP